MNTDFQEQKTRPRPDWGLFVLKSDAFIRVHQCLSVVNVFFLLVRPLGGCNSHCLRVLSALCVRLSCVNSMPHYGFKEARR